MKKLQRPLGMDSDQCPCCGSTEIELTGHDFHLDCTYDEEYHCNYCGKDYVENNGTIKEIFK